MTAEIAVLNKDAVALAADSTITISGKKTYHTTNKLFALSKYQPVGVMIYGSGELAGIPWETLIKLYRQKLGDKHFPNLVDYKNDFLRFLETEIDEYSQSDENEMVLEYSEDYLEVLIDEVDSKVKELIDEGHEPDDNDINQLLESTISKHEKIWRKQEKLNFATTSAVKKIKKDYQEEIYKLIEEKLENHTLTETYLNKIVAIAINIFCTKFIEISGVVFSGFGEKDIFPRLFTCQIECIINGKLKHRINSVIIENSSNNCAAIVPFAQTDIVATFMGGISEKLLNSVMSLLGSAIDDFSNEFANKLEGRKVSKSKIDNAILSMEDKVMEIHKKLHDSIRGLQYEYHIAPVVEAVQFLPKNEMAEVAESLVSITSFRQKISLEQESVGGAIDVAIISKSDGFVWIKRKHYFKPELNPMFLSKYLSSGSGDI